MFQQRLDRPGNDIECRAVTGLSLAQVAQLCSDRGDLCTGFNRHDHNGQERFCLKTAAAPLQSASTMASPCHGMFQKGKPTLCWWIDDQGQVAWTGWAKG